MARADSVVPSFPVPGAIKPIKPIAAPGPAQATLPPSEIELDDVDLIDGERRGGMGLATVAAWLVAGALGIGLAVMYFAVHRPVRDGLRAAHDELAARTAERDELSERSAIQADELAAARARADELAAGNAELTTTLTALQQQHQGLAAVVAAKAEALAAAQEKLEHSLGDEIKRGDVSVRKQGDDLVVGVSDRVLFERGDATLNDRGNKVLRRLAETIRANPDKLFQIAGHTDDDPVTGKLAERYPTNWELSTARATNVVRYLIEQCEVDPDQLVAAGYADQKPRASNKSAAGRKKNRRIEITLLATGAVARKK